MEAKRIGIWLDHHQAHLTPFTDPMKTTTVMSPNDAKHGKHPGHGNATQQHSDQHHKSEFYNTLAGIIRHYDSVLLFGPTDSKEQLFNRLKTDHNFENVRIEVKPADKMTEHEQQAFIKKYFVKYR